LKRRKQNNKKLFNHLKDSNPATIKVTQKLPTANKSQAMHDFREEETEI